MDKTEYRIFDAWLITGKSTPEMDKEIFDIEPTGTHDGYKSWKYLKKAGLSKKYKHMFYFIERGNPRADDILTAFENTEDKLDNEIPSHTKNILNKFWSEFLLEKRKIESKKLNLSIVPDLEPKLENDSKHTRGFMLNETYSRGEIHDKVGGHVQNYMPHRNGKVRCICVKHELNPSFDDFLRSHCDLPEGVRAILVTKGDGIEHGASLLMNQFKEKIPVFVKKESHKWEFIGEYTFFGQTGSYGKILEEYSKNSKIDAEEMVNVLFIKEVKEFQAENTVIRRLKSEAKKSA